MFYFFFGPEIKSGQLCEFVRNDPRHCTMPKLFPNRIGKRVVVDKVTGEWLWCFDDKRVTYKTNRRGQTVIEFDPRCVTSPYHAEDLIAVSGIPLSKRNYSI